LADNSLKTANTSEYKHQYYLAHKEHIKARGRQYYLDNKEKVRERGHQYGLDHKEQVRTRNRQYYLDHTEVIKAQNKAYSKIRLPQTKYEVLAHYSHGEPRCLHCGITDIDVLTIDHINGNGKTHRKGSLTGDNLYRWLRINSFPDGYQTLCFNCNFKKYIQERKIK